MKNKSNKNNKFDALDLSITRSGNNRNERQGAAEEKPLMLFSFKDFDKNQMPPGQSYETWQEDKLLAYMIEKFGHICQLNRNEAEYGGFLKIYGNFPPNSEFKHPRHIAEDVIWAVIMNIKGQKPRVAGHIIDNVFYVVFLDGEHQFYPSKKKNT